MIASVSLLAASFVSLASPRGGAGIGLAATPGPAQPTPRLTRSHRRTPRCNHGTRAAIAALPAEVAQRQAGGSPLPDEAAAAAGESAPAFIVGVAHPPTLDERDQPAPIPLLLLTCSLLI